MQHPSLCGTSTRGAEIPVGATRLGLVGVCLSQLDGAGKTRRNEGYRRLGLGA